MSNYLYFESNNLILSNIIPFEKGISLGNGTMELTTSWEYNNNLINMVQNGITNNPENCCDLRFFSTETPVITDHVQTLNMDSNMFKDTFSLGYNTSNIEVTTEKRVLQTYENCILHSYVIKSINSNVVPLLHCTNSSSLTEYTTNLINLPNDTSVYVSTHSKQNLDMSSMYVFSSSNVFKHKGYNQLLNSKQYINQFELTLEPDEEFSFYMISCYHLRTGSSVYDSIDVLLNLVSKTKEQIIIDHEAHWNKSWNTNIFIEHKTRLIGADLVELTTFEKNVKLGLFKMYSHTSDDFMFTIPALTILRPDISKDTLTKFLQNSDSLINSLPFGKAGSYFATNDNLKKESGHFWNSNFTKHIYETALVTISVWNYFRSTKDVSWLTFIGFPVMKKNSEFLSKNINADGKLGHSISMNDGDPQMNNTFTSILVYIAIYYTNAAVYELNYKGDELFVSTLNKMKSRSQIPFLETTLMNSGFTGLSSNGFTDLSGENVYIHEVENIYGTKRFVLRSNDNQEFNNIPDELQYGGSSGYKLKIDSFTIFHGSSNVQFEHNNLQEVTGFAPVEVINEKIKVNFETNFSDNAFYYIEDPNPAAELNHVIRLHDLQVYEDTETMELFLLFSSLFLTPELLSELSMPPNISFTDVISDTCSYYKSQILKNGIGAEISDINKIMLSIIEGRMAQNVTSYDLKRNAVSSYMNSLTNLNEDSPFGGKYACEIVYTLLTSICGFSFSGEMLSSRFMKKEYGVVSNESRNVLPRTIKNIKIRKAGLEKKDFSFVNVLYNDTPLYQI
jgi:hypothetical protein